jgi:signal transduction histidine kinase/ActR/RegA family two-component response regulator
VTSEIGSRRTHPWEPDFRALFEAAPGAYLALDPDLYIVAVSDSYLHATGTVREQLLGKEIFEAFPDDPSDPHATGVRNLRASLQRVLAEKTADAMAVQKYPIPRPAAAGGGFEVRYWSPLNTPVLAASGEVAYILHAVEDVTTLVRLQEEGEAQERRAEEMRSHGQRLEAEVVRRAQQIQEVNERLREAKSALERRVEERTADLERANTALRDEVERTRELEEQILHAQKMEALGTLAGGVAHDFNNLLTVVATYGEMLLDSLEHGSKRRTYVERISEAADRAASLTRQLLAFSRRQVLRFEILDLNAIVRDTERLLQRLIGEDILVHASLAPRLPAVKADKGQLEQVVMNLAVNARDAMPSGGHLTIETCAVELDERYAESHLEVTPGNYVMLAVTDTGCGMDEATRARIFEPFFTTKPIGHGTGLGLAMVFGTVKQCGGHIWVYSEVGRGTTFKVYLPACGESATTDQGRPASVNPTGTETILLVEDDEAVRAATVAVLGMLGYRVLAAGRGEEATRLCRDHAGPIHLLISDVVMPGRGGRQVAEEIRALRPGIPVLFLSGYTADAIVRHGILHEQVAFLQKPFTSSSLAHRVREVLGSPPSSPTRLPDGGRPVPPAAD